MKGVHYKAMGLQFTVHPLDCHVVGRHADLSENVFSSPGEVSSVEDHFVIFQTKFKFVPSASLLLFGHVDVIQVVHTVIHGVLRRHFPKGVEVLLVELFSQGLVGLVL